MVELDVVKGATEYSIDNEWADNVIEYSIDNELKSNNITLSLDLVMEGEDNV